MNDRNSDSFKAKGRIVIVGASLAGLRGAEALRNEGFTGHLTIIGDEPNEPYDRPPLSKQVQKGWVKADHTKLPRMRAIDAEWRLGVAATGSDRVKQVVRLANGDEVPGDALLIATGVRSRQWPNPEETKLEGVFTLRTCDDAARLQAALADKPRRVLIIGAGFIGSEVASICRDRGLEVTVAERAAAPLAGALGNVIGAIAAQMQRDAGVDLRTGVSVSALEGDAKGHVRRARLSDGSTLDVDVVVASLGSIRNVEWLEGSGLAAGFWGVACDAGCRAFDIHGLVTNRSSSPATLRVRPTYCMSTSSSPRNSGAMPFSGRRSLRITWCAPKPSAVPISWYRPTGRASSASISRRLACPPSGTRSSLPRALSKSGGSPRPTAGGDVLSGRSPSTTANGCSTTRHSSSSRVRSRRRPRASMFPPMRGRYRPISSQRRSDGDS